MLNQVHQVKKNLYGTKKLPTLLSYHDNVIEKVSIYIETEKDKQFFFNTKKVQQPFMDFSVHSLDELPEQSQNILTVVVTDNSKVLKNIHADNFNLLIVIVQDKSSIPVGNHLSSAIVYWNQKGEIYPNMIKDVFLNAIPFSIGDSYINLYAVDYKKVLSFNQNRYLKIAYGFDDGLSFNKINLDDLKKNSSLIVTMRVGKDTTYQKIREITHSIKHQLPDDWGDMEEDFFYSAVCHENIVYDDFYILYTITDQNIRLMQ